MRFSPPSDCEVLRDAPLSQWCTLHIGGPARLMVLPETTRDLTACIRSCVDADEPFRVIGRGSNLLCADAGFDGVVIATQKCRQLHIEGAVVRADAGVPLQVLIRELTKHGLGGIEYLMSVPGNVGGAIVTNAGRGRHHNLNIDEFVREVVVFDGQSTFSLPRAECGFGYRTSVFQNRPECTVLSATFEFPSQHSLVGRERIRARIDEVQPIQDRTHPNAGTVFKHEYRLDLKGYRSGGAKFSTVTPNWIVNDRQATCADVEALLHFAVQQHELRGMPTPVLEWQTLGMSLTEPMASRCHTQAG